MRTFTNTLHYPDGTKEETIVPWRKQDYIQAITDLESEVTPRRLREALLTDEGTEWLNLKEDEIETLRSEMLAIFN